MSEFTYRHSAPKFPYKRMCIALVWKCACMEKRIVIGKWYWTAGSNG